MAAGTIEIVADLTEIKPRSAEWHRLRQLGFGGSDAPTACGLNNRYGRTPYSLWAEKVAERPKLEDEDEPEYMTWGKLLEPIVRDQFAERTGIEVHEFPRMLRNSEHPFMLANVDGLTGPINALEGVYEGKTSRNDWEGPGGEVEVPINYVVQGQHYLAVLDLDVVHYACLVGGQKLRITEVPRNDQLIEDLIAIEADLWQHVLDGTPPRVEAGDKPMLSKRWTGDDTLEVEISEAVAEQLRKRNALTKQISLLEDARDACDALIMSALGDATVGTYRGDVAVTWKSYPPTEVKAYTRKGGRRFLPKEVPA
ncbi:MAG: YqaJ viral recombinase family protein [Terriglobales bacterium]